MSESRPLGWCSVAVGAALLSSVAACESERGSGGESVAEVEVWSVGADPLVSIGGTDDRVDYQVYRVVGASRLSDGRIAVAAQGSSDVRYYSGTGEYQRAVGAEGDGPGEYRAIFQLARLPDDGLLILSREPGLTWLSPDGDYVRSLQVSIWGRDRHPCRINGGNDWSPLPDGTWVARFDDNPGQPGCADAVPGVGRTTALIERQDFVGERFDTIAIMPGTERNEAAFRVYGRDVVLTTASDRVYAADTGGDSIFAFGLDGDTLAVLPMPFEQVRIPASAKATKLRPPVDLPPGVELPLDLDPPYDYPEFYPRVGRLLVDRLEYLWVMAYPPVEEPTASWRFFTTSSFQVESGGARWRVLDPEGRLAAEVRTPPGLYPLDIGQDYVLGLTKDENGVEAVELHPLAR